MELYDGPVEMDDLVAEIVNLYPETIEYLQSIGMHCLSCASAQTETLWEACQVHGRRAAKVVDELNRIINE